MFRLKILTVLVIMLFIVYSPVMAVTGEIVVRGDAVGKRYLALVEKSAEKRFDAVIRSLGHAPAQPVEIIIAADADEFDRLTENALPDWSVAAAIGGNRIVISPLEGMKHDLGEIISHELAHVVLNDAAGNTSVPRWFHEGCAEMVSGRLGITGRAYLAVKAVSGDLMTFPEIERVFSVGNRDARLAYDESLLAVRFIAESHGPAAIPGIVENLRKGRPFGMSLFMVTGMEEDAFEAAFMDYLGSMYGWRTLMTYIPGTWTIILVLAFIAWMVKKHRTRKIMRKWDQEEGHGNIIKYDVPPDDFM